jgi:hypothetical protein
MQLRQFSVLLARSEAATRKGIGEYAAFATAEWNRKKVEALCAELKNHIGMPRFLMLRPYKSV